MNVNLCAHILLCFNKRKMSYYYEKPCVPVLRLWWKDHRGTGRALVHINHTEMGPEKQIHDLVNPILPQDLQVYFALK